MFIIGESSLALRSGKYIFEEVKHFLYENGFINEKWNALNFIPRNASTIGCLDLNFFKEKNSENNEFLEKIKNNNFKTLYLLNSDNLDIKKKNEFIIYQGSHGDRSAEIADVILPNPAYTEKSGLYINLEGRVQKCNKASYPIGVSLDDWEIFNLITEKYKKEKLFLNFDDLRKLTLKKVRNFNQIDQLPSSELKKTKKKDSEFIKEDIQVNEIDYYFSNSIARASKTMSDCRIIKSKKKINGS